MSYKVGVVGEANFQSAIARCAVGERVEVFHEIGNPHDAKALVVVDRRRETIGYVGRDHWLRDLIHDEGRSCEATIAGIHEAVPGKLAVVLNVIKGAGPALTKAYRR